MDIVEFLTARLDENQATAEGAQGSGSGKWRTVSHFGEEARRLEGETPDEFTIYDEGGHDEYQAAHIARHDPAHVLAEVAAQREIINDYLIVTTNNAIDEAYGADPVQTAARTLIAKSLRMVLLRLAAPYVDHKDYAEAIAQPSQ